MVEEVIAHRSRRIVAFSIFWSDSRYDNGRDPPMVPGWQMNIRRHDEKGYDCKRITEAEAQLILSRLETVGHPDGPWTVKRYQETVEYLGSAVQASKYNGTFDDAMQRALEADGEKLRQLTGQDHGPFKPDPYLEGIMNRERFAATEGFDYERFLAGEAGFIESPTIDELVADWKAALIENTEAHNGAA